MAHRSDARPPDRDTRALARRLARFGRVEWFADFGGGSGRYLSGYAPIARHAVLVDRSAVRLGATESRHYRAVERGALHLVRADLRALPFVDDAFDAALAVRVLHRLADLDRYLAEMARTVRGRWLLDVPIKHHLRARLRALRHGTRALLDDPAPAAVPGSAGRSRRYHLAAVRGALAALGFDTGVLSSGWWEPEQVVLCRRRERRRPRLRPVPEGAGAATRALARRTVCPACRGGLDWTDFAAFCRRCGVCYRHHDGFWDFAAGVAAPVPADALT